MDYGYEVETVTTKDFDGTNVEIEMAVFKMDIIFATNRAWAASLDDERPEERRLGNKAGKRNKCTQEDQETCCAANAASDKKDDDDKVDACKKKGCSREKCPRKSGRRLNDQGSELDHRLLRALQVQNHLSMTEDDWTGIDFNAALKKYTVLESITTGAVVDATTLADVVKEHKMWY